MNHGLSANTVERIGSALAHYPEIEKAVLYGSRGNPDVSFHRGRDESTIYQLLALGYAGRDVTGSIQHEKPRPSLAATL